MFQDLFKISFFQRDGHFICSQLGKSVIVTVFTFITGLMYMFCYIRVVVSAISLGIITGAYAVIRFIAKAAWVAIKSATGFVWGFLVSAAKSPAVWTIVFGTGVALIAVNPLLGGIITAVGALGTLATC